MTQPLSSIDALAGRIASIPEVLDVAARVELPRPKARPQRIVTTGIGASEGPARLLASTLITRGVVARFVPLSLFSLSTVTGDLLVIFSQGLCPNARHALGASECIAERWLVTSAKPSTVEAFVSRGVVPIVIPVGVEQGTLLRVVGPAAASLVALRLGAQLCANPSQAIDFAEAPRAYAVPESSVSIATRDVALVAAGVDAETLYGPRWTLLESLMRDDPPVWDVLQFAHGPLQAYYEREVTFLVFGASCSQELIERFEKTLERTRHRVIPIMAKRNDELAYFERVAAVDGVVLETLRVCQRDLFDWPARGVDAPLYEFGG